VNKPITTFLASLTTAMIIALNFFLLYQTFIGK